MLFNSVTYLIFIVFVFIVYWTFLKGKTKAQNVFLLGMSYLFYGWWDERFLILIFYSSVLDFFLGRLIYQKEKRSQKRLLLALSLITNLGMLAFFKYFNFFIESFADLSNLMGLQANVSTLEIILPVGISFYTFQSLSYIIDIYRGRLKPTNSIVDFMAFVAFFPQLVAGPIERAQNLLPQFKRSRFFDLEQASGGLRLILYGLFKKMVIADRMAYFVDLIYQSPDQHSGLVLLAATFMFGFQVYCDFSGYSDIAIGSARLLGFELMQNFRTPFFSASIQEFWQRWHISLSTWFRDYIYIPLGGNQVSKLRWSFNILTTFTLSGIWHGAAFTYVIWGFINGLLLVLERRLGSVVLFLKVNKVFKIILTYTIVNLCFVLFRADSFSNVRLIYSRIFECSYNTNNFLILLKDQGMEYLVSILAAFPIFVLFEIFLRKSDFNLSVAPLAKWKRHAIYYLLVLLIALFGVYQTAPQFIYFQF